VRTNGSTIPDDLPFFVDTTRTGDLPFFVDTTRTGDLPDDISEMAPASVVSSDPARPLAPHVLHAQWMVPCERPGVYPAIMRDIPGGEDVPHSTPEGIRARGRSFAEVSRSK